LINKNKAPERKDQLLLIDASKKFTPLKKNKGDKRVEIDEANRLEIVEALTRFEDCEFARKFSKYHFYFNKQSIELTNLDEDGETFRDHLPMVTKRDGSEERAKSEELTPVSLINGEVTIREFLITEFDKAQYADLAEAFALYWQPWVSALDYKEQPLVVETANARYHFDSDRETLVKTTSAGAEGLGCGRIMVKAALKKKTKNLPERIEITVELTPDTQKDYEIIPFDPDPETNRAKIEAFIEKYVFKPFVYLDNVVGAEINFNKEFYRPHRLETSENILSAIQELSLDLNNQEESFRNDF
jgi:type I restriction enzyme M protein